VSKTIEDARHLIESRLAAIEAETSRLERALLHLGQDESRRRRRRGKKTTATSPPLAVGGRRKPTRRKVGKRVPRGRRREQLLAAIEASPGARPSELAKSIGIRPTQVSVLIAKARAEKLIVKSGEGYALKK
jgi:hypothetical protein